MNTSSNNLILECFFYTVTLERLIWFYSERMMNLFNLIQLEVQLNAEFFLRSESETFVSKCIFTLPMLKPLKKECKIVISNQNNKF